MSSETSTRKPVSEVVITLSYMVYILMYEALVIGGCGYVVFGLGRSGWWFLLALLMSAGAYKPASWNALLTGVDKSKSDSHE